MFKMHKILQLFTLLYIINLSLALNVGEICPYINTSEGTCVLITDCEGAIRSLQENGSHTYPRCGFAGSTEIVCCPGPINKFGPTTRETPARGTRIADRECQKYIKSILPPLGYYILGGEEASIGEFPHMVALGYERRQGNGIEFDCGGSLLSNYFVLTAAHCVDTLDRIPPNVARVGVVELSRNVWNPETDYRIAEVITHPDYTNQEKYHDLALLRLENSVQYNSNISPVCLYTSSSDPQIPLAITGWGQTNANKVGKSNILLKANVTAVPLSECNKSYKNWRKLPRGVAQEQLCAGDKEGIRDTCQGDSGGPLQGLTSSDGFYRLVGVTSFGRACGLFPGVYTRISNYLPWIESLVWPN